MAKHFAILSAVLLMGCVKPAAETVRSGNREFSVERLFSADGCDVYRFGDMGRMHYFARCAESATAIGTQASSNGKATSYRDEAIQTNYDRE